MTHTFNRLSISLLALHCCDGLFLFATECGGRSCSRGPAGILEIILFWQEFSLLLLFYTDPCRPSIGLYYISMSSSASVRSLGAEGFDTMTVSALAPRLWLARCQCRAGMRLSMTLLWLMPSWID
ncbi:hypothetical protein [Xanthomonas campestris]|uniref:hypothetical protein n=1 Tax=Xanthomonas campestris TaxID=339 RepID=UPI00236846C5|nr:hypothetical protein [Xanthomonas campestris]